jgi:hypothetical protein
MRYRGAWSSSASYRAQDVVTSASIQYVATASSLNKIPPNASFWSVLGLAPPSTTWYVAQTGGSDAATGATTSTPWKTIAKVNTAISGGTIKAGDTVLFNRGDAWREVLLTVTIGITIGAYGAGAPPLLSGGTLGASWTSIPTPGSDLFTNGNLDAWTSGHPTSWTNITAGTSTITQESVIVNTGGGSSVKIVNDASTSAGVSQVVTLAGATSYNLQAYYKTAGPAKSLSFRIQMQSGTDNAKYLQLDGTWSASFYQFVLTPADANWTQFQKIFTSPAAGTCLMRIAGLDNSQTAYLDDVSIKTFGAVANTYSTTAVTATPTLVARDGILMTQGTDLTNLNDLEWAYSGSTLYIRDKLGSPTTTGAVIEASQRSVVTFSAMSGVGVIQDLDIRCGSDRSCYVINCPGFVTVQRCHFQNNGFNGNSGTLIGANNINTVSGGMRITQNVFEHNNNDGVWLHNCPNVEIDQNWITHTHGVQSDGIQIEETFSGPTSSNGFYIHDNYINQLDIAPDPKGCIIINSVAAFGTATGRIARNHTIGGNFGISVSSSGVTVEDNTIEQQGTATWGGGIYGGQVASNCIIRRNIINRCVNGISFPGGIGNHSNWTIQKNTITNSLRANVDLEDAVSGRFDHNILWGAAPSGQMIVKSIVSGSTYLSDYNILGPEGTAFINSLGTAYSTLAAYQSASSQDANSSKTQLTDTVTNSIYGAADSGPVPYAKGSWLA